MVAPDVHGRTHPLTARERTAFDAATEALARRSGARADAVRTNAESLWQAFVAVLGEDPGARASSGHAKTAAKPVANPAAKSAQKSAKK